MCHEFLAPKHIDPKFLDPKYVFKDLGSAFSGPDKGSSANNVMANVFQPEKKRRRRDGYDDGDYTLFTKTPAGDFVRSSEPVKVLGLANKITFETEEEKQYESNLSHSKMIHSTFVQMAGTWYYYSGPRSQF